MDLTAEFDALGLRAEEGRGEASIVPRRAIVVVGCHRSGTSALARVLSLVGCDLPKHLNPPVEGNNELGFWEPNAVVQAHNAFLETIGSSWDDVVAVPDGTFGSAAARELRQQLILLIQEEYDHSPLFVVKDPRISRLLPLWLAVLSELQIAPAIAVAVRNPLEVAASLKTRDGFTTTKSLLLWLRYTLESDQHSRGRRRSFVVYEELLRDWQGVVTRVGEELAVTWPGRSHRATVEIEHFLSDRQRHHVFDWRDVDGRPDVVSWVKETYFALRASDGVQVLDEVRDELARADIAFGPILEEARLDLRASQEQTRQGAAARDALDQDLEARRLELQARTAEVSQLQEQVGDLKDALATSASEVAARQAEASAVQAERDRLAHAVERLSDEAMGLAAAVEAAQVRVDAAHAETAGVRDALNTAYAEVERLTTLGDEAASEADAERGQMVADLDASNAEAKRLAKQLESALLDARELAETADELLLCADMELEASRTERDRLRAEVAGAIEENGQLLILVEGLEASLERATAGLRDHERAAAAAAEESSTRETELNQEIGRLLGELGTARRDLENARSDIELVHTQLELLRSQAARERAAADAEHDVARAEQDSLVANLETARTYAGGLEAHTAEVEAALAAHTALVRALQSVTNRRATRRRTLSQLGTWLLPPTPRKLRYFWQYLTIRRSGELDVDSYLMANPDVLAAGINPVMHYVQYGRLEDRAHVYVQPPTVSAPHEISEFLSADPAVEPPQSPTLDPEPTALEERADQPTVAASEHVDDDALPEQSAYEGVAGVDPGGALSALEAAQSVADERSDEAIIKASDLFDEDFYLEQNPDVRDAGLDPVFHYAVSGHAEGRDPSTDFRTTYYRVRYLEGNLAINPLIHYETIGRQAGYHIAPGPHDEANDVHVQIRISSRASEDFEEQDPRIAAAARPDVKALAFYLPQFHAIAENDEWWGRGFTDWRNVARGTPRFAGHYQPRIPRDLGFYDLGRTDVTRRQVELAREAGLHGFVYYYYWFDGKRLLEHPLEQLLRDPSIDLPFCLMWANENWTRRWDGHEDDLLIKQSYDPKQEVELIDDFQRHFADRRYVRIGDRPLLLLYRLDVIPDLRRSVERWREIWLSRHGENPLILGAQTFGNDGDPALYSLDGAFEFPPHKLLQDVRTIHSELQFLDPSFQGQVLSYSNAVDASLALPYPQFPLVKTAVPSWDNDARREGHGLVLHGSTPALYERWLRGLAEIATAHPVHGERLVFINAWNEWAEGAYLEPDVHFGAAYLNATARALCTPPPRQASEKLLIVGHDAYPYGAQKLALHIGDRFRRQFGFEVAYMFLDGGPMIAEYEQLGNVCVTGAEPDAVEPYLTQLRDASYTVALTNTAPASAMVSQLDKAGMRVVSLLHELGGIIEEYDLADTMRTNLAKSDRVVVPADVVAEELIRRGLATRERIATRPQGLYHQFETTESAGADVRRRLGIQEGARIVLNVGSCDLRKGVDTFVHVAKLAAHAAPDLHFVWVGDANEPTVRWLRMDLGGEVADHVHFLPYTEDIAGFFAAADVFFLSSREDPYPSVVLAAMEAGLPVVAFRGASGTEDLVAVNGYVVDRNDLQGLVEVLLRAASEDDAEARAARRRVIETEFRFDDYCFDLAGFLDPALIKVSVIVPNFNYAQYLDLRLESIFGQNYPVFEIIVLDDGSTDDSRKVIDDVLARTGRIVNVVANDRNSGSVFRQWETGIRLARGEYVWIAEADDSSKPDFLRRLATCAAEVENLAFAFCDSIPIDADGVAIGDSYKPYYGEVVGELMNRDFVIDGTSFVHECLSERNLVLNVSSVLWRRECLSDTLRVVASDVTKYRMAGDWFLYAAAAVGGGNVAYIAEPLNLHRRHGSAVTASLDAEAHVAEVESVHAFIADALDADGQTREKMTAYADRLRRQFGLPE